MSLREALALPSRYIDYEGDFTPYIEHNAAYSCSDGRRCYVFIAKEQRQTIHEGYLLCILPPHAPYSEFSFATLGRVCKA